MLRSGRDLTRCATAAPTSKLCAAALGGLLVATVVLLLVSLVAAAGFAVIAQRRLRQLGMLGAIGATDRHLRLVVLADGFVVGVIAAVCGTAIGLTAWLAIGHRLERVRRSSDRCVSFPVVAPGRRRPARGGYLDRRSVVARRLFGLARISIVDRAVGRAPVRPKPAHRSAALAAALLGPGTRAWPAASTR